MARYSLTRIGCCILSAGLLSVPAVWPGSETGGQKVKIFNAEKGVYEEVERVELPDAEWEKKLSPNICIITKGGTERPYTGAHWDNKKKGLYKCVRCGTDLFSSDTKYNSRTGWPSFFQPVAPENITEEVDNSLNEQRTELRCARCGSHLGHVFDDGPAPTGKRYCINSASLKFVPQENGDKPEEHPGK